MRLLKGAALAVVALVFSVAGLSSANAQLSMGESPLMPSVTLTPLASKEVTKSVKQTEFDDLQARMKTMHAEISTLDAKIFPLRTQRNSLMGVLFDKKVPEDIKQTARKALKELNDELKPMEMQMVQLNNESQQLCMKQFLDDYSSFYFADDKDKADYNNLGFSCASGEKMVADTTQRQYMSCGMGVAKVSGGLGFGGNGAYSAGVGSGGNMMNMGCFNPGLMPQSTGKVACINEKRKVVASGLISTMPNGTKMIVNNSRFTIDGDGRVKGWKSTQGEATVEYILKGEKIEKRVTFGDKELSHCESLAFVDFEKLYTEASQINYDPKKVKPTDLVQ